MKSVFVLPLLLMLFLFSCSEDPTLLSGDDGLIDNTKVSELMDAELLEYEDQLSASVSDIVAENIGEDIVTESGDKSKSACVFTCNREYEECYNNAVRLRDSDFRACKITLGVRFETRDILCERTVVVGGGYETVINSDGEEVLAGTVVTETFICGTEEVEIWPTDPSPAELETYRQCRLDAMEYFLVEQEKCVPKRDKCVKNCKTGTVETGIDYLH